MEDFLIQHTNEAYIECIKLYFTLNDSQQKFFDNQNEFWHDILSILSGIQIIHGYKPSLDVIHAAFCGYYTTFTLTNEYGEYYEAPNYAILNGIRLDVMTQRPISIWQAYLFVNMTRIFCQLHRAPQYAAIPIFSLKDLDKIQITIPAIEKIKIGYSCFRKDVFIPVVKLVDEDTYVVCCYWWSDFKGLFQETITIRLEGIQLSLDKREEIIIIPIKM